MMDTLSKTLTWLPAETAHRAAIYGLKLGFGPRVCELKDPVLSTSICGLQMDHPIGLAAGFDKNADVPDALFRAGFGFVEVGAVTPRPQAGNPKPRVFRLPDDGAVINRMGFNNNGLDAMRARLEARRDRALPGLLGVNLGANKDSEDRAGDYAICLKALSGLADFFTINISSPNTPGLRKLQSAQALDDLLSKVNAVRVSEPVFLKIAPDIEPDDIETLVLATQRHKLSGLIVSNTTVSRPDTLHSPHAHQQGGLSGKPLFERSTQLLKSVRQLAGPHMAIIGVGGVSCAQTAYAKIRAGANAVQLYSALVYSGPGLVVRIRDGLAQLLKADGYECLSDAVGVDI